MNKSTKYFYLFSFSQKLQIKIATDNHFLSVTCILGTITIKLILLFMIPVISQCNSKDNCFIKTTSFTLKLLYTYILTSPWINLLLQSILNDLKSVKLKDVASPICPIFSIAKYFYIFFVYQSR